MKKRLLVRFYTDKYIFSYFDNGYTTRERKMEEIIII